MVLAYVLLFGVAVVLILFIVRGALVARYENDVDTRLAAEIRQLEQVVDEGDPDSGRDFVDPAELFDTHLQRVLPADDDAFFTLVDGDPFKYSFDAPAELLDDAAVVADWAATDVSGFTTIDTEVGSARALVVPVVLEDGRGTFVATAFTEAGRREISDVVRTVAVVAGLVLLATALVALLIAARIVQPIRRLTALTARISDDDLSQRIPITEGSHDEVSELGANFNAMMERVERGFVAQRRFLDDVAHELRTPITIVQGHLDVLGDDPAERAETVEILTDELSRMNRYVDDLLVLAQAERPDFLRPQRVVVADLVESWSVRFGSLGRRRWVVEDVAEGTAVVDAQRLTQAVLNLAQNAVRHTRPDDVIALSVTRRGALDAPDGTDILVVTMRDSGEGIDPEVVDELFDRHIRSASSRTEGGIGLGLSIVDAIAVAHGGSVSAASSPDGATFTLEIPSSGPPARSETAVAGRRQESR